MKIKMSALMRSCARPSPTTDDDPSTSSSRASRTQQSPEGLTPRGSSPEAQESQRPRRSLITKLGKGILNAPHAIAVRTGISPSRRAAASSGPQPQAAQSQDAPVGHAPHTQPTLPAAAPVNLWAVLDEQARLQTALRQGTPADDTPHAQPARPTAASVSLRELLDKEAAPQSVLDHGPQVGRSPTISAEHMKGLPSRIFTDAPVDQPPPGLSQHEIVPAEPETQPPPLTRRRTRVPTSLPPRDDNRSSSNHSFSTISLGSSSSRGERRDPLPPLTWRSRISPEPEPEVTDPRGKELRSRREALISATHQALQQVRLPQAKQALADDSLTREIGATVRTALAPVRLAAQTAKTLTHAGASWWNRPRQSSEALQWALQSQDVDLSQQRFQADAHMRAVDYGKHAATVIETALPLTHSILKIGVAGTAAAFGVSRGSGLAAGDALGRLERGATQAAGVRAGPEPAAAALPSSAAFNALGSGAQQWLLGSAAGAVGNMAGQYLAAPLVNMIPRQFAPIDLRAVLPDETVSLMNQLQPGAGDSLRQQVQEAQRDVASINSASNVRLGQIAFDAITAARFAAQGGLPLGVAGQVGIGLAVSSSAGMAIGSVMATRQSVATHEIPDLHALRQAAVTHNATPDSDGAAVLAGVDKNAVPLFFPKQTTQAREQPQPRDIETGHGGPVATADAPQRGRLATMRDTAQWAVHQAARPLVAVKQAWSQSLGASPLIDPAAPGTSGITPRRVLTTTSNVAASVVNRAGEMAKATLTTSLLSTGSAMLASTTTGPARRAILALGNAVGIHAAIKPWFNSLVTEIPQGDARIQAHRRQVVSNSPGDA